jgi:hypothetical protein
MQEVGRLGVQRILKDLLMYMLQQIHKDSFTEYSVLS